MKHLNPELLPNSGNSTKCRSEYLLRESHFTALIHMYTYELPILDTYKLPIQLITI